MTTNFIGTLIVTAYLAHGHIAANGKVPRAGATCAASRKIPLGTKLYIQGIGIRTVTDRLRLRYDARVDLPFETSVSEAKRFGTNHWRVWIIK